MAASSSPFEPMGDSEFETEMKQTFSSIQEHLRDEGSSPSWDVPAPDFESDTYRFDYPNRGLALIFNNERFKATKSDPNPTRAGSSADSLWLTWCFMRLGFHVLPFNNLTVNQMMKVAKKVAKSYKHEDADCFVCVVLSHGNEIVRWGKSNIMDHVVFGSDWNALPTKDLVDVFSSDKCCRLSSKPRLFFIQACRGIGEDSGVTVGDTSGNSLLNMMFKKFGFLRTSESQERCVQVRSVPLYQDCLIMYATPPGYFAFVDSPYFSWLMRDLCEYLETDHVGTTSLLRGLTSVSNTLAKREIEYKGKCLKQMAVIDHMLTKTIYLTKKEFTYLSNHKGQKRKHYE